MGSWPSGVEGTTPCPLRGPCWPRRSSARRRSSSGASRSPGTFACSRTRISRSWSYRTDVTDPAAKQPEPEGAPPPPQQLPWLEELPPRQIVAELDRYIVGQQAAKKAVAIAVRNRWRRAQAPDTIRDEILPNNIIMIGPTGVGKTEIARRLARLAGRP